MPARLPRKMDSSDVTLVIEDQSISCDKRVLCEHSDYFRAMFEGGFAESHKKAIRLQEVDSKAMRIILGLVEGGGSGHVGDEDLVSVLSFASMLQFKNVAGVCVGRLLEIVDVDNCLEIWSIAECLSVKDLARRAKGFALKYFQTLKDSEVISDLDVGLLVNYLSDDRLRCEDELDVFYVCMRWLSANNLKSVNEELLLKLLATIRFQQLGVSKLQEIRSHPTIEQSVERGKMSKHLTDLRLANASNDSRRYPQNLRFGFIHHVSSDRKKCGYEQVGHLFNYDAETGECDVDGFYETLRRICDFDFTYSKGMFSNDSSLFFLRETDEMWIYDRVPRAWRTQSLPFSAADLYPMRQLFCEDKIYAIAKPRSKRFQRGYSVFLYDCKRGEWILEAKLPTSIGKPHLECCLYKNRLLVLKKRGVRAKAYLLDEQTSTWSPAITAEDNKLDAMIRAKGYQLITLEDSVYLLYEKRCVETRIVAGKLRAVSEWALKATNYRDRKIVSHNGTVYVLYCVCVNEALYDVFLEKLCLKTRKATRVFAKAYELNLYYAQVYIFTVNSRW